VDMVIRFAGDVSGCHARVRHETKPLVRKLEYGTGTADSPASG
jgi:hypothetical protein